MNPYIKQAKRDVGIPLDKPFAQLTWDEKMRYQQRLAELTLMNAAQFTAEQVDLARKILTRGTQPEPEEYGIADAMQDFGSEFLVQAQRINPLSEKNSGTVSWWVMLVISISAVVYFAGLSGYHRARIKG